MKQKKTFLPSLTTSFNDISTGFDISIYRGGKLLVDSKKESEDIQEALMADLRMSENSVNRMVDRMIKNGWSQKRFKDAFDHVEANCTFYPPKPSEFERYDKVIRFNTYSEVCDKIGMYTAVYSKGTNEPVYITKQENELYNFPAWDEKYRISEDRHTPEQYEQMAKKQDDYIKSL